MGVQARMGFRPGQDGHHVADRNTDASHTGDHAGVAELIVGVPAVTGVRIDGMRDEHAFLVVEPQRADRERRRPGHLADRQEGGTSGHGSILPAVAR